MKAKLFMVSIIIAALFTTGYTLPAKTSKAKADTNVAYNSLYADYEWSSFSMPSSVNNGAQSSDKIYWNTTDLAVLYMFTEPYSGTNTLTSGSILNWKKVNIYSNVILPVQDSSFYFHKSFVLKKDGKPYDSKSWSSSERSSVLLFSENLTDGDYVFTYVGVYTERNNVVVTFTFTFNFTIHLMNHNYTSKVVSPSCTERGYTRRTCSICEEYNDVDIMPATGHKFNTAIITATCTESGGEKRTCSVCAFEIITNIVYPSGHVYSSRVTKESTCLVEGARQHNCEVCGNTYSEVIPALGHNYIITDIIKEGKITKRVLTCTHCNDSYIENLGNQYDKVASYLEYLLAHYSPYMIWVFLATAGVWSIILGVMIILARKNEDKEKAKKMVVNYVIGLVIIFCILVACPLLIRGIVALLE